jgi:hypothetical protein
MTADVEEWVVYHLPKSVSHGQASRIRDPRKAWPAVQKFLTALTQVTLDPRVLLMCLEIEPLEVAAARIDEARRRFGPETAQSPTLVWTLNETQLTSAIDFALDDDKFPRQAYGPSLVTFSYRFFWNAFVSDPVEENRAERDPASSFLFVTIGQRRTFLCPHFVYPAAWNTQPLRDFIDSSEPLVPFEFRDKCFKRWLSPRHPANRGRLLRLDPDWRQQPLQP